MRKTADSCRREDVGELAVAPLDAKMGNPKGRACGCFRALSLCGVSGDSLCQENQCGSCGCIVNRKEGLQQVKAVARDRVRLKWHRVKRRHPGRIRACRHAACASRLQLNDITNIATLEGRLLLDLATRHHALPMSKNYRGQTDQFIRERPMSRFPCQVSFQTALCGTLRVIQHRISDRRPIEPFATGPALNRRWLLEERTCGGMGACVSRQRGDFSVSIRGTG
jgi:hypothetical protein